MKEEKLVKKSIYFFKMRFYEIYSTKKIDSPFPLGKKLSHKRYLRFYLF